MRLVAATFLSLLVPLAWASTDHAAAPTLPEAETIDGTFMRTQGFLGAHPDLSHRLQGLESHRARQHTRALQDFLQAASYADKPSQAMIAEMYWRGEGVAVDRATAYAWMDLAAERAYPALLAKREHYWAALTPDERKRALATGQALYAEYGDDIAKPRMERVLARYHRRATGSRVGFIGTLQVVLPTSNGVQIVDGEDYYAARYWQPAHYWRWKDGSWTSDDGQVEVGEMLIEAGSSVDADRR
jgi:TPR repeat protein